MKTKAPLIFVFFVSIRISLILVFFVSFRFSGLSQNVGISPTGIVPNASAMLDIDNSPNNNKGLLIPRVTFAERTGVNFNPLPAAAQSLLVYQTDAGGNGEGYYYNTSTGLIPNWSKLFSSTTGWSTTGNTGLNAATNFLGTTDNVPLVLRTDNIERMRVDTTTGNVGIGVTAPTALLDVNGSARIRSLTSGYVKSDASGNLSTGPILSGDLPYPLPQRTLYVSPNFTGQEGKFFSTIQAAINAADGTNPYYILIYPGDYAEVITLKNNVHLIGFERLRTRILSTANIDVLFTLTAGAASIVSFSHLTIASQHTNVQGFQFTLNLGASTIKFNDVEINVSGTAVNIANASGLNHDISFESSKITAANYGILWSQGDVTTLTITRCELSATASQYALSAGSSVGTIRIFQSVFRPGKAIELGTGMICELHECVIQGGITATTFYLATFYIFNCSFQGTGPLITANGGTFFIHNSSFLGGGSNAIIEAASIGVPTVRMYGCRFTNCYFQVLSANGTYSFVDTSIRPSAGNAVDATSAITIMFGNFSSNVGFGVNITQNANSYNVNLNKPI